MKVTDTVYKGKTKDGRDFVLRYPNENDAEKMCFYINALSKEKTFIRYQGEVVTLEEEAVYLKNVLGKIKSKRAVMLIIESDNKILGISQVEQKELAEKLVAEFGISILEEIRGQGIGRLLMEKVLIEAKKNFDGVKIVILSVFANNRRAANMYRKFGFVEYGNLKGGVLYRGEPVDHIYMYKSVI